MLKERIGEAALLELTAEECTELAQACLKKARALRGDMPVSKTDEEMYDDIVEELADVRICMAEVLAGTVDISDLARMELSKKERLLERLKTMKN